MRCGFCHEGRLRLVRFEAGRDIWRCRECGAESLVLDCSLCEQRTLRRVRGGQGPERWACSRCQVEQYRCPHCPTGWMREQGAGRWRCDTCGAQDDPAERVT